MTERIIPLSYICQAKNMLSVIKKLSERIRHVREYHKKKRYEFAESLYISNSYLGEIESGKKVPSDSLLLLIALRYEVNFAWLKNGEGPMKTEKSSAERTENYGDEGMMDIAYKSFQFLPTDIWMGRILEELIVTLVSKGVIGKEDLPDLIWDRIDYRRKLRGKDGALP